MSKPQAYLIKALYFSLMAGISGCLIVLLSEVATTIIQNLHENKMALLAMQEKIQRISYEYQAKRVQTAQPDSNWWVWLKPLLWSYGFFIGKAILMMLPKTIYKIPYMGPICCLISYGTLVTPIETPDPEVVHAAIQNITSLQAQNRQMNEALEALRTSHNSLGESFNNGLQELQAIRHAMQADILNRPVDIGPRAEIRRAQGGSIEHRSSAHLFDD